MSQASAWYRGNDMVLLLSGFASSTSSTGSYLNSSTGITVSVWKSATTGTIGNRIVNARNMPYVSGSNGNYRVVVQSTESTGISVGSQGLVIFKATHAGLDGEWRLPLRGEYRRST